MVMYIAGVLMNNPQAFNLMMEKHQNFKTKPVWHVLFSTPDVFRLLRDSNANGPNASFLNADSFVERQKFDEIVLKVALERDLLFITEIVLERSLITP